MASMIRGTLPRTLTAVRGASTFAHRHCIRTRSVRSLEVYRPTILQLTRLQPLSVSVKRLDAYHDKTRKLEDELGKEKLVPHPEQVSATSSVHEILHEKGRSENPDEDDVDMLAGVKSDWKAIKETFAMQEVPKEALYMGLAGVLPYLATSVSTLYLAWDINHASLTGEGFLVSGPTAEALLHIIEPLQIGYGAVILSFLGAIHWGFEWAKYGGRIGYRRYMYGVIPPAIAWPTILFPVEYALITQFLAFTFLYFNDAKTVMRGWSPGWYSTYRFVLTFIVGASIVVSLVGRGQIADKINRLPSPADRVKRLRDIQYEAAEEEERFIRDKRARKDAGEDVDEDEDEEDEEEDED